MKNTFKHIFESGQIGRLKTKNRVKYAACSVSNFNSPDGSVTERELGRMQVISKTGAGIITNQGAYPDLKGEGKAYIRQISISDDKYIPQLKKISEMIREEGAIAIQQILHGGRYGGIELDYCIQPSDVAQTLKHFRKPVTMSIEKIEQCVQEHIEAAERSIKAGFDGIELTAFMGYLLANFLSKFTNQRTDKYGGSVENRCRFMVEIIEGIKEKIGDDHPLIVRLNGEELMDEFGGSTPEECIEYMKIAEAVGADCISIVVGWHESRKGALARDLPTDNWLYLAERAKKAVKIPIAFGPRFSSPVQAEKALAEGLFDFWEVCRPFLADPELLHKVQKNHLEEIKPCLGELVCLSRMFRNLPYICTVNPTLGHEYDDAYKIKPASVPKKIAIIGAGPSGLECAITAKKRGHSVTVFEEKEKIGGQLILASKEIRGGSVMNDLIKFYENQIKILGIELKLGTKVNENVFKQVRMDVAVVATGANIVHDILDVQDKIKLLTVFEALTDERKVGNKVLVISGQRAGLVAAEYFKHIGKEVYILEESSNIAEDVIPTFKWRHISYVKELNIEVFTNSKLKEITTYGSVKILKEEKETELEVDTIIVAGPRKSRQELMNRLQFYCDEIYIIGDAVIPRSIQDAIHEGFKLGVRV